MIVASHNVRGLGSPLKHRHLASFLSSQNVAITSLIETMLNLNNISLLMKINFMDWDYVHNLEHFSKARIVVMGSYRVRSLSIKL